MFFVFRMIYGCGLRVSEALNLKTEDINLTEKYIIIRDTKNNRDGIPYLLYSKNIKLY